MNRKARRLFAFAVAIGLYYVIHEGAHALVALRYGIFQGIRILFPGMQVVLGDHSHMSDQAFAFLNLAGALATLITAYIFVIFAKKICRSSYLVWRAICYYITFAFLFSDPIYLSLLCGFFGGGDMNGIVLFGISEGMARLIFGGIGVLNGVLFWKVVYPVYKKAFGETEKTA